MHMAEVVLKNLKKVYPNTEKKKKKGEPEKKNDLQITDEGVVAVQDFNLHIADKEFIVLVGPSGCGKSTTLRMVAGLEDISEGDLFIGDSISTGFSLYGVLDPKNVAAAVGYTPYKALNNAIDLGNGVTDSAYNYAVTMQPKRIFIMLGSNGITAAASMEESYRTLVEKLQANCPDSTVYILSVTPVTTDSSSAANAGIDNSMIRDFNKYLRDLASEKGVTYIDLYALLSDDNGYFLHEYAENDGLHFKGATYKVVLKYIEDII